MIGTTLATAYAAFFAERLPGPPVVRGMLFGIAPWLLAQVVVMPMMGAGFFSGSLMAATGSLMGHLVYGAVVGTVYGQSRLRRPEFPHARESPESNQTWVATPRGFQTRALGE